MIERYFEITDQVQDDTCFHDSTYVYKLKPKNITIDRIHYLHLS